MIRCELFSLFDSYSGLVYDCDSFLGAVENNLVYFKFICYERAVLLALFYVMFYCVVFTLLECIDSQVFSLLTNVPILVRV